MNTTPLHLPKELTERSQGTRLNSTPMLRPPVPERELCDLREGERCGASRQQS